MPDPTPIQLKPERLEELTRFLNRAFGRPEDYRRFYPRDYGPPAQRMTGQYAILEDNKIVAAAGIVPITWRVGPATLRIACVGNVAVELEQRGRGLMQTLMRFVLQQIRQENYPLALLGGQRQRYQYFGWERAGTWVKFSISRSNLKHHRQATGLPPITLEPLGEDPQTIADLTRLHEAQPVRCDRPPDHLDKWLRRWESRPFVARAADGSTVGYAVVADKSNCVTEMVCGRADTARAMVRALVEQRESDSLDWQIGPMDLPLQHILGEFAEQMQLTSAGNWQILDWPAVVGTLLQARHALSPLPAGSLSIHIRGQQTLRLEVENHYARCQVTPLRSDWEIDPMQLTRLLFGPLPPHRVMPLPSHAAILNAWCPLPLSIPRQDQF
jgi:predicted acetyltransferase